MFNIRKLIKTIVYSSLLLVLILFGYRVSMEFCWKKYRFISDQEFIDKAVEELISQPVQLISFPNEKKGKRYKPAYPIYYKNKDEFFTENPNCCSIHGRYENYVSISIRYKVKYLDSKGSLHSYLVDDGTGGVLLNYCGEVY